MHETYTEPDVCPSSQIIKVRDHKQDDLAYFTFTVVSNSVSFVN